MISDRYWRNRFGADPSVLGKSVRLSGRPYAIVGVMPISFRFPERDVDIWSPEVVNSPYTRRQFQTYIGVGRLKPGVSLTQARADLARVQTELAEQYPDTDRQVPNALVDRRQQIPSLLSDVCAHDPPVSALTNDD